MHTLLLPIALALTFAAPSLADTITLTSGNDNTIYESETGALSNGAGFQLFAGTSGAARPGIPDRITRALIAFDLSPIPDGATIESVELIIQVDSPKVHTGTLQLHKLDSDWGEGTSNAGRGEGGGAPATLGDATWIHTFSPGSLWATPGGDFDPLFSDNVSVTSNGSFSFDDPELAMDVQSWFDNPETNFGWLIKLSNESGRAIRFKSFESGGAPPELDVVFTVPEPGAIGSLAAVLTLLALRAGKARPIQTKRAERAQV